MVAEPCSQVNNNRPGLIILAARFFSWSGGPTPRVSSAAGLIRISWSTISGKILRSVMRLELD